jgi:hypothetical protein
VTILKPGPTCFVRPARTKPRVFTERDVGRIIAYARNDGASDVVLIANIMQAFGLRSAQCLLFKILDILNTTVFIGALIGMLTGIIYIIKGLRLISTGKRTILSGVIVYLIPKKWLTRYAAFLLWTGAVQAIISATIVFLTALSNNIALYLLAQGICSVEIQPLRVETRPLDVGDFPERMQEIITIFNEVLPTVPE